MATSLQVPQATPPILESPLPREVLTELYACMLRARLLAKRLRVPTFAEAVVAGTLQNVDVNDVIVSSRLEPVLEVLRGAELAELAAPKSTAGKGRGELRESKIVVAGADAAAGVAAGMAQALKSAKSSGLVVAFLSGRNARGSAWEQAKEFCGVNLSPVVLVADRTNERGPAGSKRKGVEPWPLPNISVDGRDVIAVYRVVKEAIASARRGYGPTLVEAVNFLAPGKRGRDERDPIAAFRGYLKRHDAWSDEWSRDLQRELDAELGAVKASKSAR